MNVVRKILKISAFTLLLPAFNLNASSSMGHIGAGMSPDFMPNLVNLIFNDAGSSKVTEAQLKTAEENLARGFEHAKQFIGESFQGFNQYQTLINEYVEEIAKEERNLKILKLSDDEKYEIVEEQLKKRYPREWDKMKKSTRDFLVKGDVEAMMAHIMPEEMIIKKIAQKKEELKKLGGNTSKEIIQMMGVSPDVTAYIYKREGARALKVKTFSIFSTRQEEMNQKIKRYNVIAEQSAAVARQKAEVTRLYYQIAKEEKAAELSKSNAVHNLFNSIFIDGFAYTQKSSWGKQGTSHIGSARAFQRLGEVVELTEGVSKNTLGALSNTTAILEAEAAKAVIALLYKEFDLYEMSLEHLANPSEQAILNARRKITEAEINMASAISSERVAGQLNWGKWNTYLDLLELSIACDKIVKNALLNNIRSAEVAEQVYNQKVRNVLGRAVTTQGAAYLNF